MQTYAVYGPLLSGGTTVIFESTPLYPDAGRYWDMIQRHKITLFYTAPTAVRSLMRFGDELPNKYDMSSLRVLGTVGEPINPAAWSWYYETIGKEKCTIVDTYWQTETGGHIVTNIPGVTPMKVSLLLFNHFSVITIPVGIDDHFRLNENQRSLEVVLFRCMALTLLCLIQCLARLLKAMMLKVYLPFAVLGQAWQGHVLEITQGI